MSCSALRGKAGVLAMSLLMIMQFPSIADPPPARPDYVKGLPPNQWAFAEYLWKKKTPCTKQSCMAGYYSAPLMLSVWLEKDSNDNKHSVEIVAAIDGCDALGWNLLWEKDYEKLSQAERLSYITDRVQSLIIATGKACKTSIDHRVPVSELQRLFSSLN